MTNPFEKEIESLSMTPDKWHQLDRLVSSEEYRKIVNDYQRREFELLPVCKSLFGLCRYFAAGRCTSKNYCSCKISG